jgi:hypothetical protein
MKEWGLPKFLIPSLCVGAVWNDEFFFYAYGYKIHHNPFACTYMKQVGVSLNFTGLQENLALSVQVRSSSTHCRLAQQTVKMRI